MTEKINILVTGGYGGNLGDDCLMVTLYTLLKKHKTSFEIGFLVGDKDKIKGLLPEDVRCWDSYQAFNLRCDQVVYGGGTLYYDFGTTVSYKSENIRRYLSKPKEFIKAVRKKINNRLFQADHVYYLGIGIGPFVDNSPVLARTKELLDKARFISFRDKKSLDYYNNGKIEIGEDICYSSYFKEYLDIGKQNSKKLKKKIGIVVRDWPAGNKNLYIDNIIEMTDDQQYKNWEFDFFVYSDNSDKKVIRLLVKKGKTVHIWDNQKDTIKSYLEKMQECSLVITSRFHGIIFASQLNIPFIGVNIDPKIEFIAKKYVTNSMSKLFLVSNENDISYTVRPLVKYIETNYDKCIENMNSVNKELNKSSDIMLNKFIQSLNNG